MGKRILEMLVVALLVAGTAGVFFRVVGAVPIAVTQTQKQSTFDVTGEGKVAVKPDQAEISLGVHKEAGTVAAATEATDQTMRKLSQELKKLGIGEKEIKTTNYSVYPNYGPDGKVAERYTVNSSVQVTIKDLAKAGEVVDLVGSLGLEQSGGLTFNLSDNLLDKTRKEAREVAVSEAKKKAEELSAIAGMQLGRIVNIVENTNGGRYPVPYAVNDLAMGKGETATPAQIEPGSSEVAITVTLSYETR